MRDWANHDSAMGGGLHPDDIDAGVVILTGKPCAARMPRPRRLCSLNGRKIRRRERRHHREAMLAA